MADVEPEINRKRHPNDQGVHEMKMMRFIFGLPVADVSLLPEHEQLCALCKQQYAPDWKIDEPETAVVLPCGHLIGHFCIRNWLSPFEEAQTECPIPECGMTFPCAMNSLLCYGQSIIRGRLRPNPCPEAAEGVFGNDRYENDEVDSLATRDLISEFGDAASAWKYGDEDLVDEIRVILPSADVSKQHPHVAFEWEESSSAQSSEAKRAKPTDSDRWASVRVFFSK